MMVVDSSALVAIFLEEPDAEVYVEALNTTGPITLSAVNAHETAIVILTRRGPEQLERLWELLRLLKIRIEPFTRDQVALAADAYARYGKGRGSRAQLNLCDCAAYALATSLDAPLLFKGEDFSHTDVRRMCGP